MRVVSKLIRIAYKTEGGWATRSKSTGQVIWQRTQKTTSKFDRPIHEGRRKRENCSAGIRFQVVTWAIVTHNKFIETLFLNCLSCSLICKSFLWDMTERNFYSTEYIYNTLLHLIKSFTYSNLIPLLVIKLHYLLGIIKSVLWLLLPLA